MQTCREHVCHRNPEVCIYIYTYIHGPCWELGEIGPKADRVLISARAVAATCFLSALRSRVMVGTRTRFAVVAVASSAAVILPWRSPAFVLKHRWMVMCGGG